MSGRPQFWKHVIVFVLLVTVALVGSGSLEMYFGYQENQAALVAVHRQRASAAAARIEEFVDEIACIASEPSTSALQREYTAAFHAGFEELGYVDGRTITIDWKFLGDHPDASLSSLAAEVVAGALQVIVTSSTPPLVAAAQARHTIPIVSAGPSRGLHYLGLVQRNAHPGRSVTRVGGYRLDGKAVDLLKQAFPMMMRVAYMRNPVTPGTDPHTQLAQTAAVQLGIDLEELHASTPEEINAGVQYAAVTRADALIVSADSVYSAGLPAAPSCGRRSSTPCRRSIRRSRATSEPVD